VKPRTYSSMEAFVTHWRALRAAATRSTDSTNALSADEKELLHAMDAALEGLAPTERAALEAADGAASTDHSIGAANMHARRQQRAIAKLLPMLTAAGWLQ
jgi:hypothetical protein